MLSCFRLLPSVCLHDHMDYQAFLSMGFSRQEYWSGLPCLHPGYLADPGIKPVSLMSPALAGMFFTTNSTREALTNKSVSSVTHSCPTLQPHGLQHTRLPCPSPTPGAYSNSCPSSRWCHPTISSSVIPLSFCLQSLPVSGSVLMSQFFTSGDQSIGVSASASVLPTNIQDWFLSGLTGWISLWSKGQRNLEAYGLCNCKRVADDWAIWAHIHKIY